MVFIFGEKMINPSFNVSYKNEKERKIQKGRRSPLDVRWTNLLN